MPRPVSNAEKDYSENHNNGDEIVNITIFGQPVTPDWGQLGLEILVFVLVYAALLAAVRFLCAPLNRKVVNTMKRKLSPQATPPQPVTCPPVMDHSLDIHCIYCGKHNPPDAHYCMHCGHKLY